VRRNTIFFIFILLSYFPVIAQIQNLDRRTQEALPRELIDCPTANITPRRSIELNGRTYANGGVLIGMSIGITERLMVSGSFGGENIMGEGPIKWNQAPGVGLRYNFLAETFSYPAMTFGFSSQGSDSWQDSTSRYRIKSKGFFAAMSKNYSMIPGLGVHGGLNYSLENGDADSDLNFFVGAHWAFSSQAEIQDLILHAEYDFAINDNSLRSNGAGKGYLNAGVRWAFAQELFATRLFIEFDLRNILLNTKVKNPKDKLYPNRILRIVFMGYF
jgi:hypothetical protein